MSKTLSKIMVICALAVIIPLMIIGTAFATYYSVSSTISVGLYGEGAEQDAYTKVVYGTTEKQKDFDITTSHMKTVKITAKAKGYDFVGWFEGDAKAYKAACNLELTDPTQKVEYIDHKEGEEAVSTLEMKMTAYDKVLAVFEAQSFTVSYQYNLPEESTKTTVPGGDGTETTSTFVYGAILPTLSKSHYTFNGWKVRLDGVTLDGFYKYATFSKANDILLFTDDDCWTQATQYTVTRIYGSTTDTVKKYSDETYTLPSYDELGVSDPADGKKYVWKDANNNVVTSVSAAATVTLTEVDVNYTVSVKSIEGATPVTSTLTFEGTAYTNLSTLLSETNWNTTYSFWKVAGLKISGSDTVYTSNTTLGAAIVAESAHEDATIEVEANLVKYFTTISNMTVTYKSFNESTNRYTGSVWAKEDGTSTYVAVTTVSFTNVNTEDLIIETLEKGSTLYSAENETAVVVPHNIDNGLTPYAVAGKTWLNFIEKLYKANSAAYTLADTIDLGAFTINCK